MCVIFQNKPKYTLPYPLFFNAVHNNEDGWGILMKDGNGRIQVRKGLQETVDPEILYRILKENDDVERWVHLRNSTCGKVADFNVQPLSVYSSNKRQVWFMHNGSLQSTTYPDSLDKYAKENGYTAGEHSDSFKFAVAKLVPNLARLTGKNGIADLNDDDIRIVFEGLWPSFGGRGVLLSNDCEPLLLNKKDWETIKDGENEFLASNNDYFKELKRGKLFLQRQEESRKKAEEERKRNIDNWNNNQNHRGYNSNNTISNMDSDAFNKRYSVAESMANILEDYDIYSKEGYVALANLEEVEIKALLQEDMDSAVALFMYLTGFLRETTIENQTFEDKLKKAQKHIEKFKKEMKEGEVHVG